MAGASIRLHPRGSNSSAHFEPARACSIGIQTLRRSFTIRRRGRMHAPARAAENRVEAESSAPPSRSVSRRALLDVAAAGVQKEPLLIHCGPDLAAGHLPLN